MAPMSYEEAVTFFSAFFRGEHHIPHGDRHTGREGVKAYGDGWLVHATGDLATWDFDGLTRLVFLAHDYGYRASVEGIGPGRVRIAIWKRGREGRMSHRHPTLAQAVEAWNTRHGQANQPEDSRYTQLFSSIIDAMRRSPIPERPADCDLAGWIDYALHLWAEERKEAQQLAQLLQEAHDALDKLDGNHRAGTPAERIRQLEPSRRTTFLQRIEAFSRKVAAATPGARVSYAVSVTDEDWGVYVNGPAIAMGHTPLELDLAIAAWDTLGEVTGG